MPNHHTHDRIIFFVNPFSSFCSKKNIRCLIRRHEAQFLCGVLLCPLFLSVEVFCWKCLCIPATGNLKRGSCYNKCQVGKLSRYCRVYYQVSSLQSIICSLCVCVWVRYISCYPHCSPEFTASA